MTKLIRQRFGTIAVAFILGCLFPGIFKVILWLIVLFLMFVP
jgi:hypothetical protein